MATSSPRAATTQPRSTVGPQPGPERRVVIHTEHLTKVYPGADSAAVDALNLDVYAGEIFGLLARTALGRRRLRGCSRPGLCRQAVEPSSAG